MLYAVVQGVDIREGYACLGVGGVWEILYLLLIIAVNLNYSKRTRSKKFYCGTFIISCSLHIISVVFYLLITIISIVAL